MKNNVADVPASTIATLSMHQAAIARLFAGEASAWTPSIDGSYAGYYGRDSDEEFARWCDDELDGVLAGVLSAAADPVTFHPLVIEFAPFGVHYVDALFGAQVYHYEGQTWSELLPMVPGDLAFRDIAASPLVDWTCRAIAHLLAQLPAPVAVTFPIFSSPLNVAVNLFGENFLVDIAEPDEGILHGLQVITAAIRALHELMQARFPGGRVRFYCSSTRYAPDGVGHICGCSTQLVGPQTYAHYLAPLDASVLQRFPAGGTIHLCGRHTQHLPCWRAMTALRAVQLNDAATDDFSAYWTGLRDDQLIYITPTDIMPIARILDISGGQRVIIQAQYSERLPRRTS